MRFETTKPDGFLKSVAPRKENKKAVLSQKEPRDAAVNFDTYQILQ